MSERGALSAGGYCSVLLLGLLSSCRSIHLSIGNVGRESIYIASACVLCSDTWLNCTTATAADDDDDDDDHTMLIIHKMTPG